MDAVLLDTNVFSYFLRGRDTRADLYGPHIQGQTLAISFVTAGELYYWAERRKWAPGRIASLESRVREGVIIPYDFEICKTYARLKSGLRTAKGTHRIVGDNDLWIAACAVRHSIPLITHNRRHFEGIPGLNIVSEAP